ncbi:TlpA family protein disulfide reductase [Chloroflexota bacterium]
MQPRNGNEFDVDFVPVSVFFGCCPVDVLRYFAQQNNLDWPWILDSDYTIADKYGEYLAQYGYPTLVFIDRGQTIRDVTGYLNTEILWIKIDEISR